MVDHTRVYFSPLMKKRPWLWIGTYPVLVYSESGTNSFKMGFCFTHHDLNTPTVPLPCSCTCVLSRQISVRKLKVIGWSWLLYLKLVPVDCSNSMIILKTAGQCWKLWLKSRSFLLGICYSTIRTNAVMELKWLGFLVSETTNWSFARLFNLSTRGLPLLWLKNVCIILIYQIACAWLINKH